MRITYPPIRTAVVGYGLGSSVFHAPLIAGNPAFSLDAIVTRDISRRAQVLADHPRARIVASLEALWEMPSAPELVVISTPNATHAPLAIAALQRGAHVVVDKPMALTVHEARTMANVARTAGRLLVPFQNRRWDGDFLTLTRLVQGGALGTVVRLESSFDRWRPVPKGGWREEVPPDEGGGLLYDIGSHLVDQALRLLGPATSVYAELDTHRDVAADDDAFISLHHEGGARSHLRATVLAAQAGPRFRASGTAAAWVKWGLDPQEALLKGGARPAPGDETWAVEPESAWGTLAGDGEATRTPMARGDYPAFYAGVAAAIHGDAPPPVTVEEAIDALRVLEAARLSSAERRVVTLG